MKILTIIGARPQFIKATVVSRAIRLHNERHGTAMEEKILHTGQHYDHNMSQIFFNDLSIPRPTWLLDGSATAPQPLSEKILKAIGDESFDCVILYGDTNSTLAGALAAEKRNIPIAHIEAGLRSFNDRMPEEYNRIETDKRSHWLFCPTQIAVDNLHNEHITGNIYQVGDVMYDTALLFGETAERSSDVCERLNLPKKGFYLATIHRAENICEENLSNILSAFNEIANKERRIVLPLHPHTRSFIQQHPKLQVLCDKNEYLIITEPANYLDMIMLEKSAALILTDSGGIQKEAYFHQTPCVTLRNETEWIETVAAGWNILAGTDKERIKEAIHHDFSRQPIKDYGSGDSAQKIIQVLCSDFNK